MRQLFLLKQRVTVRETEREKERGVFDKNFLLVEMAVVLHA